MDKIFEHKSERFTLTLSVSPDKLKLFVDAAPAAGVKLSAEEVNTAIAAKFDPAQFDQGVWQDVLKILGTGQVVESRRLIKGEEAVPGKSGKVLYLVRLYTGKAHVDPEKKGVVNYADILLFDNVLPGQVIGRIYLPKPGVEGKDVLGKSIPAPAGKPATLKLDSTCKIGKSPEPDVYDVIEAGVAGYVVEKNGTVSICEEFVIAGDVDFHTGNVDFVGKLRVNGDVAPGFTLRAKEGITIKGASRGAKLQCLQGPVVVEGMAFGGEIISGQGIMLSSAHEVKIDAAGDIEIKREAIDCELHCQKVVRVAGGPLVGGRAFLVGGIEAKEIGHESGKATELALCNSVESTTEYTRLIVEVGNHDRAIELLRLHLGPYAAKQDRVHMVKEPLRTKLTEMMHKLKGIDESRIKLLAKKQKLLAEAIAHEAVAVNYLSWLRTGVTVRAGDKHYEVANDVQGPGTLKYTLADQKFEIIAFAALPREGEQKKGTGNVKRDGHGNESKNK